jgi:hypothetical protein
MAWYINSYENWFPPELFIFGDILLPQKINACYGFLWKKKGSSCEKIWVTLKDEGKVVNFALWEKSYVVIPYYEIKLPFSEAKTLWLTLSYDIINETFLSWLGTNITLYENGSYAPLVEYIK